MVHLDPGTLIADGFTFCACVFLTGRDWGRNASRLDRIEERLKVIESMFKLTLKNGKDND